jgi:hypothetical protein
MVNAYVGEYATYPVPDDVMAKALALNAGKRLNDRRTKGAKHLEWWGRSQDATYAAMLALEAAQTKDKKAA